MPRPFAIVAASLALVAGYGHASAQGLGGFFSPGPLAEEHAELEGITQCAECHEPGAGVAASRCLSCHETVQAQITARRGFHADLDSGCATCHSDHKGRDFELIQLDEDRFNHQRTGFALRGAHAPLACADCHTDRDSDGWGGLTSDCASCHAEPHGVPASTRPLLEQCRSCHDDVDWHALPLDPAIFDHDDPGHADYPLKGRHAEVDCADCHPDARFVPIAAEACTDCHDDIHGGQFGARPCTDCHDESQVRFQIANFDHSRRTDFDLEGVHGSLACATCHGDGERARYVGLPHATCEDCHDDVHDGQFAPRDCSSCHSQDPGGFDEGVVDHDQTDFPLRFEHARVECVSCHGEGPQAHFANLPSDDCDDCHTDFHKALFEPDACTSCHTDGLWHLDPQQLFDHARTGYALRGAHAEIECADCHGEGDDKVLKGLAAETCLDCHAEDDPHAGQLEPASCTGCHDEVRWANVTFDHRAETGFPLAGAHAEPGCADCHDDPAFAGEEPACESCHTDDRPANHYEGTCAECHQATEWSDATLGALGHASTGFPLDGAHAALTCADCHAEPEPAAAAGPECVACHAADDPHRNQLGDDCGDCHATTDWLRTSFRHSLTGWPLRGAHAAATCEDCHAAGFAGTPEDCVRCHADDKPDDSIHRDPLTSDCEACHREFLWEDARYPHGGAP